ncbi:MAG: hypothetical protein PVG19_07365 [Desulfobacterales bacterium]
MKLPQAFVVHSSPERIRIRIPRCRRDLKYFSTVRKAALNAPIEFIRINALTASILFKGNKATAEAVAEFGEGNRLFAITSGMPAPSMAKRIAAPLTACDRSLKSISAGQVDLPGTLFILLLFTALYEIARGRFRTPPWYTAFWYAFGLFTKALIDRDTDA